MRARIAQEFVSRPHERDASPSRVHLLIKLSTSLPLLVFFYFYYYSHARLRSSDGNL